MTTTWSYVQGYLCVAYTEILSNVPERVTLYWPCLKTRLDEVQKIIGTQAYDERNGIYAAKISQGLSVYWRRYRLQNGNQTKPIETLREPLLCPRVRKDIKTRYRAGRWEKYLKAAGWVSA